MCRAVGPEHGFGTPPHNRRQPRTRIRRGQIVGRRGDICALQRGVCRAWSLPRLTQWARQGLQVVAGGGVKPGTSRPWRPPHSAVHASCRITLGKAIRRCSTRPPTPWTWTGRRIDGGGRTLLVMTGGSVSGGCLDWGWDSSWAFGRMRLTSSARVASGLNLRACAPAALELRGEDNRGVAFGLTGC